MTYKTTIEIPVTIEYDSIEGEIEITQINPDETDESLCAAPQEFFDTDMSRFLPYRKLRALEDEIDADCAKL